MGKLETRDDISVAIVVPGKQILDVLKEFHVSSTGHVGVKNFGKSARTVLLDWFVLGM